jgi:hypothetical protein
MHNSVYLILLCLICSIPAHSQYKNRYKRNGSKLDIRYGLRLGYQLTNFKGDDFLFEIDSDNLPINPAVTYESLGGIQVAAYVDIRLSELLVIQPEIQFSQIATRMTRRADLLNEESNFIVTPGSSLSNIVEIPIDRRLSYIQIPMILKIGINRLTHINMGPVLSFKVNESFLYGDVGDSLIAQLNFIDIAAPDFYNPIDLGAIVGVSHQLDNGFNFNLRYNRNFRNINKNELESVLGEQPRNTTSALSMSIGYTFQYDKRLRQSIERRH